MVMDSVLIKKTEKYDFYSDGRIWSHWYKKFLTGTIGDNGYNFVTCYGQHKGRHIWIAKAFIPNPDNLPCVNHKDENKLNNCADNLEWCTYKYNSNYGTRAERFAKSNSIKVVQCAPDYPFEPIKVWDSATEAVTELRKQGIKVNKCNINKCLHGLRPTAGGFGWAYYELLIEKYVQLGAKRLK